MKVGTGLYGFKSWLRLEQWLAYSRYQINICETNRPSRHQVSYFLQLYFPEGGEMEFTFCLFIHPANMRERHTMCWAQP